ncbi:MAG: hypothetical protein OXD34_06700 [bacterium]|nr:hypothetical protein [bacterium]
MGSDYALTWHLIDEAHQRELRLRVQMCLGFFEASEGMGIVWFIRS